MSRSIFPEFERALVQRAGPAVPSRSSNRFGRAGRSLARGLIPAVTVAVSIAVLVVGVVALHGGRVGHGNQRVSPAAQPAAAAVPVAVRPLLATYAVFRRAQTPGDLAIAGTVRTGGDTLSVTNLVVRGEPRRTYLVSPIPSYAVIPALTRAVERDGTRIGLFVQQLVRPHVALRVTTVSGRPVSAATRAAVLMVLHGDLVLAADAGGERQFELVIRVAGLSGDSRVLPLGPINPRAENLYRLLISILPGGHGTIAAVVPNGVRSVTWAWSPVGTPNTPAYRSAVAVSALVVGNVAVAYAPSRFTRDREPPSVVTLVTLDRRLSIASSARERRQLGGLLTVLRRAR